MQGKSGKIIYPSEKDEYHRQWGCTYPCGVYQFLFGSSIVQISFLQHYSGLG